MKSDNKSGNGREDASGESLADEVQADGASSAEAPPDSYMTTDGSAATSVSNPGTVPDIESAIAEQKDKYLRLAAEYDNFRRRATKERQESGSRAQADLLRPLLDALDDLSRFAHLDPVTTPATTIVEGVQMVEKKMLKAFGSAGLQIVDPVGQPFDPSQHEAVSTEPAKSAEEDHIIARVYQPGYVFNGQLLRPARVVVKQFNG